MWTYTDAIKALESHFGVEAVRAFMTRSDYELHELSEAVKYLHDVYGREETAEIFKVLNKEMPDLVEFPVERSIRNLAHFSKKLWTHKFSEHNVLDYIEVGTNHIVLYPKPTDIGRRFLACLVATMWNPSNEEHFDPYAPLKVSANEITYAPALDHAGYKYSNSKFTLFNGPELLRHYHPVKGGSWHTHFHYNKQFPGLLAVYSVIKLAHHFIDEDDNDLSVAFQREMMDCINEHANYIVDILLEALPEPLAFYDNSTLDKLAKLQAIFLHIKEKGVFNEEIAEFELVKLTQADYAYIESHVEVDGAFMVQILKNFLFDLETYQRNLAKLSSLSPLGEKPLLSPTSTATVKKLFQLSCCLNSADAPLVPLPPQELSKKSEDKTIVALPNPPLGDDLSEETLLDDLKRVCGFSAHEITVFQQEHAQQCRQQFDGGDNDSTDKAMVGYRARVAHAMHETNYRCRYNLRMFAEGQASGDVDRVDTLAAVKGIGAKV